MKKPIAGLIIAGAANLVFAGQVPVSWTLPTENVDGFVLFSAEIEEVRIYCNDALVETYDGPVTSGTLNLPPGDYICHATIFTSRESDASNDSAPFRVLVPKPKPPLDFLVTPAEGQIIVGAPPVEENSAPVFNTTPAPVFTEGVASSYSLSQHVSDADGDELSFANEAGCTLPTGVSIDNNTLPAIDDLDATTGTSEGTTENCVFSVSDGEDSSNSDPFDIVIGAAPSEGAVDHGDEYVLTGSGFEVVLPGLWDTVDNIAAYSGLSDGNTIPTTASYPWADNTFNNPDRVKYETGGQRHSNSTAHYFADAPGYLQYPRAVAAGGSSPLRIYASFYFKPSGSIPGEGHSSKFMRVWDDTGGTGSRISWTQNNLVYDSEDDGAPTSWAGWGGSAGQWNRLELYIDMNDHVLEAWTNYSLRHDVDDIYQHSGGVGDPIQLSRIGFDLGGVSPPNIDIDFDDIYVARSPARVELCNNATYASRTHCEIQPATFASATSITISVNRGTFTTGTYHLHILDDDNASTYYGELELE